MRVASYPSRLPGVSTRLEWDSASMKYNLLGAVSTIALGAAFGIGTPGAVNAALVCTGTTTNGQCKETDTVSVSLKDFTSVPIAVDYFHNGATGVIPGAGVNLSGVTY